MGRNAAPLGGLQRAGGRSQRAAGTASSRGALHEAGGLQRAGLGHTNRRRDYEAPQGCDRREEPCRAGAHRGSPGNGHTAASTARGRRAPRGRIALQ